MRVKGFLTAAVAAGVLLLAPGLDGARADQSRRHGQGQHQSYHGKSHQQWQHGKSHRQRQHGEDRQVWQHGKGHGYGWWGRQYLGDKNKGGHAYGKRARAQAGDLSRHDRKKLKQIRSRFDNERAFRHYLQHRKPGLFARYMGHNHQRHQVRQSHRPQRHVWYRGQTLQLR